jgi:hypothetical protein
MINKKDPYKLIIKKRANWLILLLTGSWTFGWLASLVILSYGFITNPEKFNVGILILAAPFFALGIYIMNIFLWHLQGKEIVQINERELTVQKAGLIFSIPTKLEIDLVGNFQTTQNSTIPRWLKFYGISGGKIQFKYMDQIKYFGQDLTKSEAEKIIEILNEKTKATNR